MRAFAARVSVLLLAGFLLTTVVGCSSSPTTANNQPAAPNQPANPEKSGAPKGTPAGKQPDAPKHVGEN